MTKKVRSDKWSLEEDRLLASVVLKYIRIGGTQLDAFDEVADKTNRSAGACGFRWNNAVRHNYENAIEQSKKERRELQNSKRKKPRKLKVPYVWKEGMTPEEAKNVAYAERNLLALLFATEINAIYEDGYEKVGECGYYIHGEWEGWSRVVSLMGGAVTFHVPDDFDLGDLPEIESNYDGHTTEEKWEYVMNYCGCELDG